MSYRDDYDPQGEEPGDYSSHRGEDRRHHLTSGAHRTTGAPPAGSNPEYKVILTHGESTSYYNPANTFPDEAPLKPTTSDQPPGEEGGEAEADTLHPFPNALHHASLQSPSTPSSLFTNALHHLHKTTGQPHQSQSQSPLDEASFVQAHQAVYNSNSSNADQQPQHTTPCIGMAAAMNALKTFTAGRGEGNSQGEFIGHAMAQAGKLFDEQHSAGNVAPSANKQDAISHAAQMAYKLYTKSGSGGGGGPGGFLGKLL